MIYLNEAYYTYILYFTDKRGFVLMCAHTRVCVCLCVICVCCIDVVRLQEGRGRG